MFSMEKVVYGIVFYGWNSLDKELSLTDLKWLYDLSGGVDKF